MAISFQASIALRVRGDGTHASAAFDYRQVPAVFSHDAGPGVVIPSAKPTGLRDARADDDLGPVAVTASLHNFAITVNFAAPPPADHLVNVSLTLLWEG